MRNIARKKARKKKSMKALNQKKAKREKDEEGIKNDLHSIETVDNNGKTKSRQCSKKTFRGRGFPESI